MRRVRHLHSSGRYDRDAEAWGDELLALVVVHTITLITLTEAKGRERAVGWQGRGRQRVRGWQNWRHYSARDCLVAWDTRVWRLVSRERHLLARMVAYFTRMFWPFVVLEHRETGERWLWVVGHLPTKAGAGPAGRGPGWSNNKRSVTKYRRTLRQAARRIWRIQWDHVVVTADWNLDLQDDWTRHMLADALDLWPALPEDYRGPGTHGHAVIDGSLVDLGTDARRVRVLPEIDSSDHQPFVQTLISKEKPWN